MSAAPVRDLFDALRSRDVEAVLRLVHPDIEVSDPERTGGPFHGHQEYVKFLEEWMETWDQYELRLEAPVVIGDTVVALVRHLGRASASGVEVDQPGAIVHRVRDDLIVFIRPYTDRDEALEAAGLQDTATWRTALDVLLTGYDAWNRRDFEALAPFLEGDAEFFPVRESPDMAPFSGREGAERFWEQSVATWEKYVFTPLAFEPHGDRMLVEVRANVTARGSGIELEEQWAHLYTLRDGRLVRLQAFTSTAEARAALAYPEPR